MEFLNSVLAFINGPNMGVILVALLAVSEALGLMPSVKANGVFQAIGNGLKWLKGKLGA